MYVMCVRVQKSLECRSVNFIKFAARSLKITFLVILPYSKIAHQGRIFLYVVQFLDHSTKYAWVYPMRTREEFIEKLRDLIDVKLKVFDVKIGHYHAVVEPS